ncbi:6-phosphofructo-2-kinase/fructose-2,6-bisphosphatase 3 isoform X2 [Exaiptasia diaphana]|uniref:6-phosphofructo-2-kinase domain-containing protein n=1 Tax=Exaiptasia diaphana TaxID=2652724 RepID=A0A913XGY5_EXADI|nr:6-phosphofructo-2-kinase/fructose-2,6-bisphosphatase 3 isoform X2 [Exaiptasia diaphana]KXJ12195.1 6-phosphofructo-2-kinase/fructose-2,6-bisphosphatase 2 [Exaiptasia diaphana]
MESSEPSRFDLERSMSQAELEFEDFLREEEELQKKRYKPQKATSTIHPFDYKYKLDCTLPEYCPRFANVPTVIVLVGLPARGKTYMAKKLGRYLNWISIQTNVFNVGEYRRKVVGTDKLHDFFRPDNDQAQIIRRQCALTCLEDVSKWLNNGGQAAIFDATNTTRERRRLVLDFCRRRGFKVFFMESVCTNMDMVSSNVKEVKVFSPDYKQVDKEEAYSDFLERIKHYEEAYEPLCLVHDGDMSFIKIINAGEQYLVNHIDGYLQSKVVYFLMNLHIRKRSIYLVRHAECQDNVLKKIGGDSDLTVEGDKVARAIGEFVDKKAGLDLKVWTSQLKRAVSTAKYISKVPIEQWKALDEMDFGEFDGMDETELEAIDPEEHKAMQKNRFVYRYPRGESYSDVCTRLEPVIMELERQNDVLVISHQPVIQILMAYFTEQTHDVLPFLDIPLNTVFKLTPIAYGCRVEKFPITATLQEANEEEDEIEK